MSSLTQWVLIVACVVITAGLCWWYYRFVMQCYREDTLARQRLQQKGEAPDGRPE